MIRTKWANHKFTRAEQDARKRWRKAQTLENDLFHVLKIPLGGLDRDRLHKALDRRLDDIERIRNGAKEMFPEVDESFTIARDVLRV